jgi:hypothetical protein
MKTPENTNSELKPQQLFNLAGACVALGKAEGNSLRRGKGGYQVLRFGTDYLSPPDQTYYDFIFDNPISVSRRYAGSIAIAREKAWTMRMKESSMVYEGGTQIDQCQIMHVFKWSEKEIMKASRTVHYVDFEEDYGPSYQEPYIGFEWLRPDFLGALSEVSSLRAGDCEELTKSVMRFGEELTANSGVQVRS